MLMLDLGEHGEVIGVDEYVPAVLQRCKRFSALLEVENDHIRRLASRRLHTGGRLQATQGRPHSCDSKAALVAIPWLERHLDEECRAAAGEANDVDRFAECLDTVAELGQTGPFDGIVSADPVVADVNRTTVSSVSTSTFATDHASV